LTPVGTVGNTGSAMQPTPRRLTTHQKAVLIQVLLGAPCVSCQQVGVCYYPSASDALGYAQDFLTVFNVIGWKVTGGAPSETLNGQFTGLALVVLPPCARQPASQCRSTPRCVTNLWDRSRNVLALHLHHEIRWLHSGNRPSRMRFASSCAFDSIVLRRRVPAYC
jgi:hypothetical protein